MIKQLSTNIYFLFALALISIGSWNFFQDYSTIETKSLEVIGSVSSNGLGLKQKLPHDLDWKKVDRQSPAYENSLLLTDNKSNAEINLTSGEKIKMSPSSLIRLTTTNGEMEIELEEGEVFVQNQGLKRIILKVNDKKVELDSSGANFTISKNEENISFKVKSGELRLAPTTQGSALRATVPIIGENQGMQLKETTESIIPTYVAGIELSEILPDPINEQEEFKKIEAKLREEKDLLSLELMSKKNKIISLSDQVNGLKNQLLNAENKLTLIAKVNEKSDLKAQLVVLQNKLQEERQKRVPAAMLEKINNSTKMSPALKDSAWTTELITSGSFNSLSTVNKTNGEEGDLYTKNNFDVDVIISYKYSPKISYFTKLGLSKNGIQGPQGKTLIEDSGISPRITLGSEYKVNKKWSLMGELEYQKEIFLKAGDSATVEIVDGHQLGLRVLNKFRIFDKAKISSLDILGGLLVKAPTSVGALDISTSFGPSFGAIWSLPLSSGKILKLHSHYEVFDKNTQGYEQKFQRFKIGVGLQWSNFP